MASRQAAIRAKCEECCAEDSTAIRCCPAINCSLWLFRMGYANTRNSLYYNREFFLDHWDMATEQFNRVLKQAQLAA